MKIFLKVLKWIAIVVVLIIGVFVVAVYARQGKKYDAPYPDIHSSTDSTIIARGRYLAYGPAHCSGCHSPSSNWERLAAGEHLPLEGGLAFPLELGTLNIPNITP